MNRTGLLKPLALVFVGSVLFYAAAYFAIEHRRTHNGPWQIAFTNDPPGNPAILVNQPRLGITNVLISFPGETVPAGTTAVDFNPAEPREGPFPAGFGQCRFMDTTFLPGTIVFDLFGHQVQLMPRVLTIDRVEHPWRAGEVVSVSKTNSLHLEIH